jgi:hypothetical protein
MQGKPGHPLLLDDHPGAKLRWDKKKPESVVAETTLVSEKVEPIVKGVEVSVA